MENGNGHIRVQLVDDQVLIREALARLIGASAGIEVVAMAGNVAEAILYAEELQPDVVLMDVLEDAGVFEGIGAICQRCPRVKLVVLDEAPRDAHVRAALRINAAGYLTKHQPLVEIEAALRRVVRGDRVFAPEIARRLVLTSDGVQLTADAGESAISRLTPRETDVLIYLAQGQSVKQCAKLLGIGVSTVGNHKSRLMKKLDIHKTVELSRLAIREGLVPDGRSVGRPQPVIVNGVLH